MRVIMKLLLTLFVFAIFMFTSNNPVTAQDGIYERNSEVYVMISSGTYKGIYRDKIPDPDKPGSYKSVQGGIKLFPNGGPVVKPVDPSQPFNQIKVGDIESSYNVIAVDQFRNIYVLSSEIDKSLAAPQPNNYYPIDPPQLEGVVGVGADANGTVYYDFLNYKRAGGSSIAEGMVAGSRSSTDNDITNINPASLNAIYLNKYSPISTPKRLTGNKVWYCGYWPTYNNRTNMGYGGDGDANYQCRWDFQVQKVNVWITHFVETIPNKNAAIEAVPGYSGKLEYPPVNTEQFFEQIYNTTNMTFNYARRSTCGDFHPDSANPTPVVLTSQSKQSLCVTGAGRRYSYSSLPNPTVKMGNIAFCKTNGVIDYGIPASNSSIYLQKDLQTGVTTSNGSSNVNDNPLTPEVCSIGAATHDTKSDWVYIAPNKEDGDEVIDFKVSDQWDGKGGVLYRLLKSSSNKYTLKWNKYLGYSKDTTADPDKIKTGTLDLTSYEPVCIGPDGRGSVYWLTKPKPQTDGPVSNVNYFNIDGTPLAGNPPATVPTFESSFNWYVWQCQADVPVSTELWYLDYYTKNVSKVNTFRVGTQRVKYAEYFSDAAGQKKIKSKLLGVIDNKDMPDATKLRIALATINIAGPPKGNNEKNQIDIVSTKPTAPLNGITYTDDNGAKREIPANMVEEATEDQLFTCKMENAPTSNDFSHDDIAMNKLSGTALKDKNGNNIVGGFYYSVRPGTARYYWKVEMIEPVKKIVSNMITASSTAGGLISLDSIKNKDEKDLITSFPAADVQNWFTADATAKAAGDECDSTFAFTPREPGIYKVSLVALGKFYQYDLMPYPSYITDRDNPLYKPNTPEYLVFGDTKAKVATRYVVVGAKGTAVDPYITKINITGPSSAPENDAVTFSATATFQFARSINHEKATDLMETYNGIGMYKYPADVANAWGLPAYDNIGENYTKGSIPNNFKSISNTGAITYDELARNYGEVPLTYDGMPNPPLNAAGAKIYKTSGKTVWIEGAGTQTNPTVGLSRADRGAITYEWYLAAENTNKSATKQFLGMGANREPDILIAKGRLSDEKLFADGKTNAVVWASEPSYVSSNDKANKNDMRKFNVTVNLRYAFDTPLEPGRYFLYIKFKHPTVQWVGRSPKLTKPASEGGVPILDAKNNPTYAYYDLVAGPDAESSINDTNWDPAFTSSHKNVTEPFGFEIVIKDHEAPQAYFVGNTGSNPDASKSGAPAAGVTLKGATTGDAFPSEINYTIYDNNPNLSVDSKLKIYCGPSFDSLGWQTPANIEKVTTDSDEVVGFNDKALIEKSLKKTITEFKAWGTLQDIAPNTLNPRSETLRYPGYGSDAPYRKISYRLKAKELTEQQIPMDMVGSLGMYVDGTDKSEKKNQIGDTNGDGKLDEYNITPVPADKQEQNNPNKYKTVDCSKMPASIRVLDNDSPSLTFSVLDSRNNIVNQYKIISTAQNSEGKYAKGFHQSYKDTTDWDGADGSKLKFTSFGNYQIYKAYLNIDQKSVNKTILEVQDRSVDGKLCKQFSADLKNDPDIVPAGDNYVIKFNGQNKTLSKIYNDYSMNSCVYFDFDQILPADKPDSTLEITEDSRTKFIITADDNVDSALTSNMTISGANCNFEANDELGTIASLEKWSTKSNAYVTYGIFRDPSKVLASGERPCLFITVSDSAGNVTAVKIPTAVLHTVMNRNVVNVEATRTN